MSFPGLFMELKDIQDARHAVHLNALKGMKGTNHTSWNTSGTDNREKGRRQGNMYLPTSLKIRAVTAVSMTLWF